MWGITGVKFKFFTFSHITMNMIDMTHSACTKEPIPFVWNLLITNTTESHNQEGRGNIINDFADQSGSNFNVFEQY